MHRVVNTVLDATMEALLKRTQKAKRFTEPPLMRPRRTGVPVRPSLVPEDGGADRGSYFDCAFARLTDSSQLPAARTDETDDREVDDRGRPIRAAYLH